MAFIYSIRRYLWHLSIAALLLGSMVLLPVRALATTYGGGNYGGCPYSTGCVTTTAPNTSTESPTTTTAPAGSILLNDFSDYFSGGKSLTLTTTQAVYFIVTNSGQNVRHSVTVKQINADSVTLTLASNPFDVTLLVGQTNSYDVTGDGIDDIQITLTGISNGQANLIFKNLLPQSSAKAPTTTTPTIPPAKKRSWLGLILSLATIIVAVIAFIVLWWKRRKRSQHINQF